MFGVWLVVDVSKTDRDNSHATHPMVCRGTQTHVMQNKMKPDQ